MTEEERQASAAVVRQSMTGLADWLAPRFPHHSMAMRQELGRERMNTDRWNRIACLLSSLHSVPGAALVPDEHVVRNIALSAIAVAQKMAAAGLGCTRDPDHCIETAAWIMAEITVRLERT